MDKTREDFDKWLEENGGWVDCVEHAWTIWQDARASMEVKLPECPKWKDGIHGKGLEFTSAGHHLCGVKIGIQMCETALKQAGLKVIE